MTHEHLTKSAPAKTENSNLLQRAAVYTNNNKTNLENQSFKEPRFNFNFAEAPVHTTAIIQPKLKIGAVGDKYEQEADRVAAQVVHQLNAPASQTKPIQRQEILENEEVQMKPMIQTSMAQGNAMVATPNLETSINQIRGSGQGLADIVRQPMERVFGTDFSQVRIHTDTKSHKLNQSIQAKAFTVGQDIFFRQGGYKPESRGGQELIAHELTHVVKQEESQIQAEPAVSVTSPTEPVVRSKLAIGQQENGYKKEVYHLFPDVIQSINKLQAATWLQRKAYIGDNHDLPTNLEKAENRALHEDEDVRRFNDQKEFETFAAGGAVEGVGQLSDRTWVRLPKSMLVLGENHGDPKAPEIIKATKIKNFRYERFSHYSATRLKKSEELQKYVQESEKKSLEKLGLVASDDEPTHEAEHTLPKFARAVADVIELVKEQELEGEIGGKSLVAKSDLGEEYSLVKALLLCLFQALIYCKSYHRKFLSHPLKQFYNDNKAAVDEAIVALEVSGKNKQVPDFRPLTIKDKLDSLATAYETAAKSKLGLTTPQKIDNFKEELYTRFEPKVTISERAKEDDYLRDASMYETIKKAKSSGDRLFVIGDAHRHKLSPLIKKLGLKVMPDKDFVTEQKTLDANALDAHVKSVREPHEIIDPG
jgi:Domain of unknown function (DUF4157)